MLHGRIDLQIFERGTLTGQGYCDLVRLPHVRLFRRAFGPKFIFMDNNAPTHRTAKLEELLGRKDIRRKNWTHRSPDLNLIENV